MFVIFSFLVDLLFRDAITQERGKKEGWSLFIRLLLKLFEIAACTMQVWVDDGDDEWHCVQTLTEANNW